MAVWHFPLQKLPGPTALSPFLCLQLGSANPMTLGSPEPAPYSQLVPNSAREQSPPAVRPGQGYSRGSLGCASTGPQVTLVPHLLLLPAWDVTDLQGRLPAMMPACVLSPVVSREGFQRGGNRRVWLQRHRHCSTRRGWQQTGFSGVCQNLNSYSSAGSGFSLSQLLCPQCCF